MVKVEVTAPLVTSGEDGLRLQVAGSVAAFEAKLQLRFTVPVKPFGVMVMVEVLPLVAPGLEIVILPLLDSANVAEAAAVMVTETVVV
jgi:hypothetical protein